MQRQSGPGDVSRGFESLACGVEAVTCDDAVRGNAPHSNGLAIRADNVLEGTILVQESISPKIAYDHSLLAYTYKKGLARFVPIIQSRKAPIAINESVRKLGRIAREDVVADNHAVIVESTSIGLLCSGKVWHCMECAVAVAFEDVEISVGILIFAQ